MQGEGATHHEQLHKTMQRREKEAKPVSLKRPEEPWSAVQGRRVLRPEPRPAEESPRAALGQTTSPASAYDTVPQHTAFSLFSDHCRLSPTSRPTHAFPLPGMLSLHSSHGTFLLCFRTQPKCHLLREALPVAKPKRSPSIIFMHSICCNPNTYLFVCLPVYYLSP